MGTFKHSGALGDLVFSLPTLRALGGGVLYLDPRGGLNNPLVHRPTRLNSAAIQSLKPLLLQQPYITEVREWNGEVVDYDLDLFRKNFHLNNLSDSHLLAFELPFSHRDQAWLTVADPIRIPGRGLVISRSVRYHGNYAFWVNHIDAIKDRCVFVGYPQEHAIFEYTFETKVPYYPTQDMLTLARVIAGCDQFIGNQSFPHALAEGMKKKLINEVFRVHPAAIFERPDAEYV